LLVIPYFNWAPLACFGKGYARGVTKHDKGLFVSLFACGEAECAIAMCWILHGILTWCKEDAKGCVD
jgi:hypothetical protein